jgi:hypothetical protein
VSPVANKTSLQRQNHNLYKLAEKALNAKTAGNLQSTPKSPDFFRSL